MVVIIVEEVEVVVVVVVVVVVLVVVLIVISFSSLLRRPMARKLRKLRLQNLSSTASHNNEFCNSVKDALKVGEKYATLYLAVLAVLGAVAGVSSILTKIEFQYKKLKARDEKIASLEKLMNEKINSSVQKSVHVALENFLKYSCSNEYKDMRESQAKQSIVPKDDDKSNDICDDSKTKPKNNANYGG